MAKFELIFQVTDGAIECFFAANLVAVLKLFTRLTFIQVPSCFFVLFALTRDKFNVVGRQMAQIAKIGGNCRSG